jgi:uncharacterized protein YgbK (DUF1537 family)
LFKFGAWSFAGAWILEFEVFLAAFAPSLFNLSSMIGVIADDLSGAAELGGIGLRRGLTAEILVGGRPSGRADLVCVDTDSRSCPPAEAGRRAAAAAKLLADSGAGWLYKKTDSVLRGQVVAEVKAILKQLRLKQALLVPANPSLGRVIHNGTCFVHGRSLDQTEFARDPEHPRRSAKVIDLVPGSGSCAVHVCPLAAPFPPTGIVIGEAQTPAHLRLWAARRTDAMLVAGAAEFFGALLIAAGLRNRRRKPLDAPTRTTILATRRRPRARELFVCGSTSESSREFVAAARERGTPIFSLLESATRRRGNAPRTEVTTVELGSFDLQALAEQAVAALRARPRVLVNIGPPLVTDRTLAKRLHLHLAALARLVLQQVEVEQLYVEGGATAVGLVRRMGWNRLMVIRDLAPGSATLGVENRPGLQLTVKPGTYRWPKELWHR